MQPALTFKLAFWLVIIGLAAQLAPNPAWPEWLARMTLSAGVALGVVGLLLPRLKGRKKKP